MRCWNIVWVIGGVVKCGVFERGDAQKNMGSIWEWFAGLVSISRELGCEYLGVEMKSQDFKFGVLSES
jgi:hypothetical protein